MKYCVEELLGDTWRKTEKSVERLFTKCFISNVFPSSFRKQLKKYRKSTFNNFSIQTESSSLRQKVARAEKEKDEVLHHRDRLKVELEALNKERDDLAVRVNEAEERVQRCSNESEILKRELADKVTLFH